MDLLTSLIGELTHKTREGKVSTPFIRRVSVTGTLYCRNSMTVFHHAREMERQGNNTGNVVYV